MSEYNYFKSVLMNPKILGFAFLSAFKKVLFLMLIIGTPTIYFGFESSWYNQVGLFLLFAFMILIPYFIACLFLNKSSLNSIEDIEKFESLSDKEKGEIIGDELSGIW